MLRDYTNRSRIINGTAIANPSLRQGICLCLCFMFLSHTIHAQVFPLPEQEPEWVISTNGLNGPSEERFTLTGEHLTIRGQAWPMVQKTSTIDLGVFIDTVTSSVGAYFVDGDKVYFKEPVFGYEGLLYDFSAEVGDTFFIVSPGTSSIDSTEVTVWDKRITNCDDGIIARTVYLRLNSFNTDLVWKERAGAVKYPFISDQCIAPNCDIVYEGNKLVVNGTSIRVEDANDCLTSNESLSGMHSQRFSIYPNPAAFGTIDLVASGLTNTGGLANVTIVSSLGQRVKQWQGLIRDGVSTRVDVQGVKPGSYFVVLRQGNSVPITRKLVIAR